MHPINTVEGEGFKKTVHFVQTVCVAISAPLQQNGSAKYVRKMLRRGCKRSVSSGGLRGDYKSLVQQHNGAIY